MASCRIIADGNALLVFTPYNPDFVYEIKRHIPATDRRFDGTKKAWAVAPKYGQKIQDIVMSVYNEMPLLPNIASAKPVVKQQIINVRYVGVTKDRGNDERSAFGFLNGGWNAIFPEQVLRSWFDGSMAMPDEAPTLYSVLSVQRSAADEQIKAGYRRMVLQWHPDRCREPNAQEQFMAIQHAYEVLTKSRERYDAGLALEASLRNSDAQINTGGRFDGYRTPLRCGLILCEGTESLGIFNVSKIFAWEDIRDGQGRTLVVSWPKGADKFQEEWC